MTLSWAILRLARALDNDQWIFAVLDRAAVNQFVPSRAFLVFRRRINNLCLYIYDEPSKI